MGESPEETEMTTTTTTTTDTDTDTDTTTDPYSAIDAYGDAEAFDELLVDGGLDPAEIRAEAEATVVELGARLSGRDADILTSARELVEALLAHGGEMGPSDGFAVVRAIERQLAPDAVRALWALCRAEIALRVAAGCAADTAILNYLRAAPRDS